MTCEGEGDGGEQSPPDLSDVLDNCIALGLSWERAGKFDKAIDAYQKAVEINPTSYTALLALGTVLNYSEQYAEAESALVKALDYVGDDAQSRAAIVANLGISLYHQDRHDEAVVRFKEAIALTPEGGAELYTLLGESLYYSDKEPEALEAYD